MSSIYAIADLHVIGAVYSENEEFAGTVYAKNYTADVTQTPTILTDLGGWASIDVKGFEDSGGIGAILKVVDLLLSSVFYLFKLLNTLGVPEGISYIVHAVILMLYAIGIAEFTTNRPIGSML